MRLWGKIVWTCHVFTEQNKNNAGACKVIFCTKYFNFLSNIFVEDYLQF